MVSLDDMKMKKMTSVHASRTRSTQLRPTDGILPHALPHAGVLCTRRCTPKRSSKCKIVRASVDVARRHKLSLQCVGPRRERLLSG
jgi:hypothetical protein